MRYLCNKEGSSSILVVLTFTMLVIFSLLVMMSSHSDYRLAQKNLENTENYYELTGEAHKYWYEMDNFLSSVSSEDALKIRDELEIFDSTADIDIIENKIIISKSFDSNDKEILIKLEYLNNSNSLNLVALKEVPKRFEYENTDFEDVEVYTQ